MSNGRRCRPIARKRRHEDPGHTGSHPSRAPDRGTGEHGFTLVELLVSMAMFIGVIGVPMTWVITSMKQENITASRALSTSQAEAGLVQLTNDLREVVPPSSTTPTTSTLTWGPAAATATLTLPAGSQGASTQTVTWSCSFGHAGICTRQAGSNAAIAEITNVQSVSFAPKDLSGNSLTSSALNPAYVGITLSVQNTSVLDSSADAQAYAGAAAIVLTDGVQLRNNAL